MSGCIVNDTGSEERYLSEARLLPCTLLLQNPPYTGHSEIDRHLLC